MTDVWHEAKSSIKIIVDGGDVDDGLPVDRKEYPDSVSWQSDASDYRGKKQKTVAFVCPPNGKKERLWGGSPWYQDDSSVCTAGVHAGKITFATGGKVTIKLGKGLKKYPASAKNGVNSSEYDSAGDGSFRIK